MLLEATETVKTDKIVSLFDYYGASPGEPGQRTDYPAPITGKESNLRL
jgi:hypothetical protein